MLRGMTASQLQSWSSLAEVEEEERRRADLEAEVQGRMKHR